jgi:hypothetical protein
MEANEVASADALQVGQQLQIPLTTEQSKRVHRQLDGAHEQVQHMAAALAEAEHALNEAQHAGASVHADIPHIAVPDPPLASAPTHLPTPGVVAHAPAPADVPMVEPVLMVPSESQAKTAVDADYVVKALKPGTELRIQNNAGSIKMHGGSGQDCTIKAKVEAKDATPDQAEEIAKKVLIQVTPQDGIVQIGVQFPDEMSKEQREAVQVHFDMTVPRDCIVRALQNVGDISLAGLGDSAIQAKTNVGTIRTRDVQNKLSLVVNVGDIEVIMPNDPSAQILATAKVGAIKSDLPLDITSASVMRAGDVQGALGSSASGVLGAGQGRIDLATNVGSIRIRSATKAPLLGVLN